MRKKEPKKLPPKHPPKPHDIPPHIYHEIMVMKDEIGRLKGKVELLENLLLKKGGDKK
jgi:hypothetical protein